MSAPGDAAARPRRSGRQVSVDWCEASVRLLTVGNLFVLLAKHLGEDYGQDGFQVLRDDEARFDAMGPFGMRVRADLIGQVDRRGNREPWVGIRVPGEACRVVGTNAVLDLVEMMGLAGKLKVSRLDLALDDFDRSFSPRQFAEACVVGRLDDENARLGAGVVTRVRPDNWEWRRRYGGCFWLGGRQSQRLLRVYDKEKESGGAVPSVRVELQCRDEFATFLTRRLLDARWQKRPLAEVWGEHVVAFVDLREPEGHRSGSAGWRRVRWWRKLVGDAGAVATAQPDDSSIGQWMDAMQKQCGGFLRVLLLAEGVDEETFRGPVLNPDQLRRMVDVLRTALPVGEWRLSGEHRVRVKQLREARERAEAFAKRTGWPGR